MRALGLLIGSAVLAGLATVPAMAQDAGGTTAPALSPDDKDKDQQQQQDAVGYGNIVVTGTKIRQGGAQDARHFRASANIGMPRPESLTIEGLMGEHDLTLPSGSACAQIFCLVTEAMPAGFDLRPNDRIFVGLGFTSNIDADKWRREPLNLVAVVDKSGSMDGHPLDLVRKSLRQIVGQMRAGDQISIVLYGDTSAVYLAPTEVGTNRSAILDAIGRIRSEGSTNMEAGLRVGYETAFATAPKFRGITRLMQFTDEQPNVGATDAESFMGMAQAASRQGIGLTVIGVGVQYDGELATTISSVRGGNLFFIAEEPDVKDVFEKQLDLMVTEVAHDVRITIAPRPGYKVAGVFGVPDHVMSNAPDGAVTITVPTAFLSTNGGGIFASLSKSSESQFLPAVALTDGQPLLDVSLSYVGARDGRPGSDRVRVAAVSDRPSEPLRVAHRLVDEFLVLQDATLAFHRDNKPKQSFALLNALSARMDGDGLSDLKPEQKLVSKMLAVAAFYSGYGGEQPRAVQPLVLRGIWKVANAEGIEGFHSGDTFAFDEDELTVASAGKDDATQGYEINESQIRLTDDKLVFSYRVDGDRLTLEDDTGTARIMLRRVSEEQPG